MKIPDHCRWKPTGRTLGEGRQAAVIAVTDKTGELSGDFALKRIGSGKGKAAYERFAREIEAIKAVDHPGIVKVIDCSAPDDDFQFYVMEIVNGARSLKQLLGTSDNPFHGNPLESLRLFIEISSALNECERLGIIHRDLSPANVLIAVDGAIKIIDFGLCQFADDRAITLVDEGVGTPNYMAPECESGASGNIRSTADLYSAGKLLWSAMTNQFAFSREEAVYNAKSLWEIFPNDLMAWHLQHIFAGTIRHSIGDRFPKAGEAIRIATRVQWLITTGKPPLLKTGHAICPICGWGKLERMDDDWRVFHNSLPSAYGGVKCVYCGFCFVVDHVTMKNNVNAVGKLR